MPGGVETPRSAKQRSLPFLINRYSVSAQIRMLEAAGFEAVEVMVTQDPTTQEPHLLAKAAREHGLAVRAIHAPFLLKRRNVSA